MHLAAWIDSIRRTTLGGLVLGFAFVWIDPAGYSVGVGLSILVEQAALHRRTTPGT